MILQSTEDVRHLCEGGSVAECSRFALDDRQIMAPIIDDFAWLAMGSVNDALMCADGLPFCDNDQPLWVNTKANRLVRKTGRHAVPVALESDQACW